MIELSTYTGKDVDSICSRMKIASELKSLSKKENESILVRYTISSQILARGFKYIDGYDPMHCSHEVDVKSVEEFYEFAFNFIKTKHSNPRILKNSNKFTVMSFLGDEFIAVDVITIEASTPSQEVAQIHSLAS